MRLFRLCNIHEDCDLSPVTGISRQFTEAPVLAQPLAHIGIFEVEVQPQATLLRQPDIDFVPV